TFTQLKGDCYPELVEVFYNNVTEVDGNIHSRVKGVDIVIKNDTWLEIAGLKDEGRLSHQPDCLQNQRTRKTEMFKDCMRIPTNWVVVFKWHIFYVGINNWHRLQYGLFISKVLEQSGVNLSREKKLTCTEANLIRKATLTCIGLKKTAIGWYFSDEVDSIKGKEILFDSDNDQEFPPSNSEFEKRVGEGFERATKRINALKKTLTTLNEKMD
ncbi:hypothetical protein V8G54_028838, partial [Vigna mungo]